MLAVIDTASRNESNADIFKILNMINSNSNTSEYYLKMLDEAIDICDKNHHDRTKVQLLLSKANKYFSDGDYRKTKDICNQIEKVCESDKSLDSVLIEVYSLKIQIAYNKGDINEVVTLYNHSLDSSNSNNKAIAIIREIGGLYHMEKEDFSQAYSDFFEALKRYQEAGLDKARNCLVYLLMANILNKNAIDPFNSREAQLYANDKMIIVYIKYIIANERIKRIL